MGSHLVPKEHAEAVARKRLLSMFIHPAADIRLEVLVLIRWLSNIGMTPLHAGRQQIRCFASVQEQILQKNQEYPVMIYSKSWCPFCHQVKDLFHGELKVDAKFAELDELGAII